MRILVTGASGFVGSLLLPPLLWEGHTVRALGRDPARVTTALAHTLPNDAADVATEVEVLRGDTLSGEGLARALDGIEVAYYLIHSMESPLPQITHEEPTGPQVTLPDPLPPIAPAQGRIGRSQKNLMSRGSFSAREQTSAQNFAVACSRAGVRRIVYLGGPLPRDRRASRHLHSRASVERILLQAVPDSVALRASIVIGARSRSFRLLVRLVERLPILTLPAWRSFRTQPVDERDIVELLLAASVTPAVAGRTLDVGGVDVLSYGEMISRIADLMLVRRPVLGLGVNATPLAARLVAAITEEDPELIVPLMESLQGDLLPADDHAAELLNVNLHSFNSAVEHALREWEESEPLTAR